MLPENINSPTLRQDLFQDKKGVHIKIEKEIHTSLRSLCLQRGTTMQDIFCEFANLLIHNDKRATGILDSFILRKLNQKKKPQQKRKKIQIFNDTDKESLYDLIGSKDTEQDIND